MFKKKKSKSSRCNSGASDPLVAICIPSYNYDELIGKCIESVLQQTYHSLEIIISDDCSSDNSDLVIRQFKDERIHYIRQPKNLGMVPNWRACLAMSSAPYTLLIGADDYLKPRMIEKCVSVLESDPDIAFCHTAAEFFDSEGKIVGVTGAFTPSYVKDGEALIGSFLCGKRVCNSASVFRRSYFDLISGWSEKYRNCMDQDLWFRLLLRWKVGYVGEILTGFHSHPTSEAWRLMQIREDLQFLQDMFDRLPDNLQHLYSLRDNLTVVSRQRAFHALSNLPPSPEREGLFRELFPSEHFNQRKELHSQSIKKDLLWVNEFIKKLGNNSRDKLPLLLLNLPPVFRYLVGALVDWFQFQRTKSI